MGLKMNEKKAVAKEVCQRYRAANCKEKSKILDEFLKTTGYRNRKYAIRMLNHLGKTNLILIDGETVKTKVVKTKRPANRKGKVIYDNNVINVLVEIWGFFNYRCGKYLAPFLRGNMPFLERNDVKDFHVTPEIRQK
jgi:hypothetical protein